MQHIGSTSLMMLKTVRCIPGDVLCLTECAKKQIIRGRYYMYSKRCKTDTKCNNVIGEENMKELTT